MLELEAMGLDRVKTEVSVQYVDHNIIQLPAQRLPAIGVWYSRPENAALLRNCCPLVTSTSW